MSAIHFQSSPLLKGSASTSSCKFQWAYK